ncbi:MAG TPA: hypothetical protein VGN83_03915 [Falsiroseomonas sp.]|jgi:hypothetical protein|nr:hypothetical protein [Falsiroseomonas sp.]
MPKDDRPLVRGNHLPGSPAVTEGGKAPRPGEGGHPKPSASRARAERNPESGTSRATQGQIEKQHAEIMGAQKPQSRKD